MSLDQESGSDNADIMSMVSVDTQYPVERLTFKWRISNYSKIFNTVQTEISTPSKFTTWVFKFITPLNSAPKEIVLSKHFEGPAVNVEYKVAMKTKSNIIENTGKHIFYEKYAKFSLLKIPVIRRTKEGIIKLPELEFENDMLNFECRMTILGHSISRILLSPIVLHSEKVNKDVENLYRSNQHSDVSLSDGKNVIPAHKNILSARSPVFNIMFQQNMLENRNNVVEIDDIEFETLKYFLYFLYSGKIKQMTWYTAVNLYYAADKYDVQDLRNICSEFLQRNLTIDNACSALKLADQHKDDALKKEVVFFIQMHVSSIKLTQGWKDLVRSHPKLIAEICN